MSRIGKKPVTVPKGARVAVEGGVVRVEGPKGKLEFSPKPQVRVTAADGRVSVEVDESLVGDRAVRALWGTTRALINNMLTGVTTGYRKQLKIVGVGWTAQSTGKVLKLNVGLANTLEVPIPAGITVVVEKDLVTIDGADKQAIGQFAAVCRSKRKPEPYNGKGVRYIDEVVRKKEGKAFGK